MCRFGLWCLPCGTAAMGAGSMAPGLWSRRRVAAGDVLVHAGEPFRCIHAVSSGSLKSSLASPEGREQVCAFPMVGDVVGLDGVCNGHHQTTVTALEDSQTCAVVYAPLVEMAAGSAPLQHGLTQLLGREITRSQELMRLLNGMNAHERVAAFLLDLSQRSLLRGMSDTEFVLRMTRADLASYLGLSLETVSRAFSHFKRHRVLEVDRRRVRIVDLAAFAGAFTTPAR